MQVSRPVAVSVLSALAATVVIGTGVIGLSPSSATTSASVSAVRATGVVSPVSIPYATASWPSSVSLSGSEYVKVRLRSAPTASANLQLVGSSSAGGVRAAVGTLPNAKAGGWQDCGGSFQMMFMHVEAKGGLPCSSAWILGKEALESWNGFSKKVKVRGFTCTMYSGYPYHAGVSGTCKRGGQGAKFFTGD